MSAVQAQVLSHYRSDLVERIRASGHILSAAKRVFDRRNLISLQAVWADRKFIGGV